MRCPVCGTYGLPQSNYKGGVGYVTQIVCPKALLEKLELFEAHGSDADYLYQDVAREARHPMCLDANYDAMKPENLGEVKMEVAA